MYGETSTQHTQKKAGMYKTDHMSLIITCTKHDRISGVQIPRQIQRSWELR